MPDSYVSRPGGQINPQRSMSGVRHLSEELIKSAVKDTSLDSITILKLNFSELSGKKIKVIENLEKLRRLHTLNLAHNSIEKLERLDTLLKLKDLDVSHNEIYKIEGLEKLANLVSLNLEGNDIELIPVWMGKKLRALRNLRLASNNIEALQELRKLRGLPNLTFLTVAHNPICELPHYRLYIIYHLRSLDVLDGRRITPDERLEADRRFDQDEVEALHGEVSELHTKYERLQEEHNKSLHDLESTNHKDSQLIRATKEHEKRIRDLQSELITKEDMIGRKQAELSRANQKHYELEQELAFYKIDTKFTSLHKKPETPSVLGEEGESPFESPYIGKSQHAKDRPNWPVNARAAARKNSPHRRGRDHSPDSLDSDLDYKQRELETANRKLAGLTDQLHHTEERIADAAEHLVKLTDLANRSRGAPLPEHEKEDMEKKLDTLQQTIDELENNREQLLDNLDKNAADISEAEQNLDDLDRSLDASDLEDSEKEALLLERDDKDAFLTKAKDMRDDLEQALTDLEQVLEQKKAEAQQLDHQLANADNDLTPEANPDIGNVAEEVKNILTSLRQGPATEREAQKLKERLAELEDIAEERERARRELEKTLLDEQAVNTDLKNQLEATADTPDGPTKSELEDDVRKLLEIKDQLEDELRRQENKTPDHKTKKELAKLKRDNEKLKRDAELGRSMADAEMLAKLDAMVQGVETGEPATTNSGDPVARRIAALQKSLQRDKKQSDKEARKLRDENARLQREMADLSSAIGDARSKGNDSTDSESAALVDTLKRELDAIRSGMVGEDKLKRDLAAANDRLRRAQAELERSKQQSRATDQPRLSPSKFNKYSIPPQFDLEAGLDDSYDDSESTRDTVRHAPSSHPHPHRQRPVSRYDERDSRTPNQGSNSQNSGRATDENPRLSAPPRQNTARVPPHPDDMMSIQSEAPVPYRQPRYPDVDGSPPRGKSDASPGGGGRAGRASRSGAPRGLGTVPETYESDMEHPRSGAPKPDPQAKKLKKELAKADHEIDRLQQILHNRDRDLDETLRRTDLAEDVIAKQRDEADKLRAELEKYKQELDRLASLLANQGRLGDDDIHRIQALQRDMQQADQNAAAMMSSAAAPPQYGQHTTPHSQYPPQPSQYPHNDYAQTSASFIQGPSFRPGEPGSSPIMQGQMMTSTPHRQQNVQPGVQQMGMGQPLVAQPAMGGQPQYFANQPMQPGYAVPPYTNTMPVANPFATGPSLVQSGAPNSVQSQPTQVFQSQSAPLTQSGLYQTVVPGQTVVGAPATVTVVPGGDNSIVTVTTGATPTKTVVLNSSLTATTTPVKSILKTSDRSGHVCTIPEHHNLEDEHCRLREKYRSLKGSLKRNAADFKEERKVAEHAKAASQLKHALQERRSELESLDLAINMQREQLHTLKHTWKLTKKNKSAQNGEASGEDEVHSEMEHYMNTELQCLEETLSKRRAELREADKRLADCRKDLEQVKGDAEQMIIQYDNVKGQLDDRTTELHLLVSGKGDREKEVAELMVEVKTLTDQRDNIQGQITEIESLTTERDEYFNNLTQRISQSETVLTDLQAAIRQQTADAEQNLHEIKLEAERHLNSVRQSETELSEHYSDIRDMKSVLAERESQLSTVNTNLGSAREELSLVQKQSEEQRTTLQQLEAQAKGVEGRIQDKRSELGSMSSLEREMKDRLEDRRDLLDKVKDRIEDEKEALQTLSIAVEQKEDQLSVLKKSLTSARSESADLLRDISERRCLLESLGAESNVVEKELTELRAKHTEGRQLLDKLEYETTSSSTVLDKLHAERESLSRSITQKTTELQQQTMKLDTNKAALSELSSTKQQIEGQIREKTTDYEKLQSKLRQLQSEVDDIKFSRSSTDSELESVTQTLKDQKSTASKLKKVLKDMENKKNSLASECEEMERQRSNTEQNLGQIKYEYQQLNQRLMEVKGEFNEQQVVTSEIRQEVGRLNEERNERQRALKELSSQYERESQQLTEMTERAERELSHMRDQQQVCQTRVEELTRELSRLMSEINRNRKEHGNLTELKAKLQQAESDLDGERSTNADLMRRLTEFAQRLQTRNDSLTKVKQHSDDQIHGLSDQLSLARKETKAMREKCEAEMEDLELIAQQHAQRADRLDTELSAAREHIDILKKNVMSLELNSGKDDKIAETILSLRQDIQQEVTMGMAELEKSRVEATTELDELRSQKVYITNEVIALKENLNKVQSRQLGCMLRPSPVKVPPPPTQASSSPTKSTGTTARRKMDAEQQIVRQKMHEQMQRHLDAMEGMKTHSMSILSDLQDRVSSLQGVLSESTNSIHNTTSPVRSPVRSPVKRGRNISPVRQRPERDTNTYR